MGPHTDGASEEADVSVSLAFCFSAHTHAVFAASRLGVESRLAIDNFPPYFIRDNSFRPDAVAPIVLTDPLTD